MKGAEIWLENGVLRYKAPKGVLTQEELKNLRRRKDLIVAFLERLALEDVANAGSASRATSKRAPLTFSQLAHWNLHRLAHRRTSRYVACATRLQGPLDVAKLRNSLTAVIGRHDALRTRILVIDGVPVQEVSADCQFEIPIDDLAEVSPELRENEVKRLFEKEMFEPIDVAGSSLFASRLLRLGEDEHVLIVAMEHIISDGFSLGVLLRDLFATYLQLTKGSAVTTAPGPVQFPDYAIQQRAEEASWLVRHGGYWQERFLKCPRLRFPVNEPMLSRGRSALGVVRFLIERDLKDSLRQWSQVRRATLVMTAFAAYVVLVLRWCKASEGVIAFQSDGRFESDLLGTIGYLAFRLYLRIDLHDDDTFVTLLNRITEEYVRAHEHADFSYWESQPAKPDFTRNTCFNWRRQELRDEKLVTEVAQSAIRCSRIHFEGRVVEGFELDAEPLIGLLETENEVRGSVQFPLDQFPINAMERFARNYLMLLKAMLENPQARVKQIPLL
jgi:hypothetical protein